MRTPNTTNYSLQPDALKQIEAKMRQMQATGTVVTPEMMEAMYSAALKTGTDLNRLQGAENVTGMKEAYETRRQEHAARKAQDAEMAKGIGGTLGNIGLRYGAKYVDKKFFPETAKPGATPGASVSGELNTIGGQPMELGRMKTLGGENVSLGGQPTLMPEGNPLAGYGSAANMESLELAPSTLPGPGPVTAPPVTPGPLVGPTVETGGAILPSSQLGGQGIATPVAELGTNLIEPVAELGGSALAETGATQIGSQVASTAPAFSATSALGPAGAGSIASGIMGATGVRDDVGKAMLLGQGGENEQDIAGGVTGGAAAGAAAGTWVFPGVGTAVGGLLGGIAGGVATAFEDDCIIVTCCHGSNSKEVQIAKEYRDRFMSKRQIRGYYVMAELLVPRMTQKPGLKKAVKRLLVDRLIPYGMWATGKTTRWPSVTSYFVTKAFLGLCSIFGALVPQYERITGEVY